MPKNVINHSVTRRRFNLILYSTAALVLASINNIALGLEIKDMAWIVWFGSAFCSIVALIVLFAVDSVSITSTLYYKSCPQKTIIISWLSWVVCLLIVVKLAFSYIYSVDDILCFRKWGSLFLGLIIVRPLLFIGLIGGKFSKNDLGEFQGVMLFTFWSVVLAVGAYFLAMILALLGLYLINGF